MQRTQCSAVRAPYCCNGGMGDAARVQLLLLLLLLQCETRGSNA